MRPPQRRRPDPKARPASNFPEAQPKHTFPVGTYIRLDTDTAGMADDILAKLGPDRAVTLALAIVVSILGRVTR